MVNNQTGIFSVIRPCHLVSGYHLEETHQLHCSTAHVSEHSFKYSESIFMNYGKCNKVLNRNKQARRVKRALNCLLWSKDIVVNTKTRVFCIVIVSILSYGWEIWTPVSKLKKKLFSTEMDFGKRAARTSRQITVRKEVIREKMQVTNNCGKTREQHVEMLWTCSRHREKQMAYVNNDTVIGGEVDEVDH